MTKLNVQPRYSFRQKPCRAPALEDPSDSPRRGFGAHPCYLFAYGTLLTGTPDRAINQLISNFLRPKSRAYILGRLHDFGTYPGALPPHERNEKIFGQIFSTERPRRVLSALDAYEGYSPLYPHRSEFVRRAATAMQLPCQTPIRVWVYYYNWHPRRAPYLSSGDYLAVLSQRQGKRRDGPLIWPPAALHV